MFIFIFLKKRNKKKRNYGVTTWFIKLKLKPKLETAFKNRREDMGRGGRKKKKKKKKDQKQGSKQERKKGRKQAKKQVLL